MTFIMNEILTGLASTRTERFSGVLLDTVQQPVYRDCLVSEWLYQEDGSLAIKDAYFPSPFPLPHPSSDIFHFCKIENFFVHKNVMCVKLWTLLTKKSEETNKATDWQKLKAFAAFQSSH